MREKRIFLIAVASCMVLSAVFSRVSFSYDKGAAQIENLQSFLTADYLLPLFFSLIIIITSLIVLALSFVFGNFSFQRVRLRKFGLNSLLIGLWSFVECDFVAAFAVQPRLVTFLSCLIRSALPLCFVLFLRKTVKNNCRLCGAGRFPDFVFALTALFLPVSVGLFLWIGYDFSSFWLVHIALSFLSFTIFFTLEPGSGERRLPLAHGLCLSVGLLYFMTFIEPFLNEKGSDGSIFTVLAVAVALNVSWILYMRENFVRLEESGQIKEQLAQSQTQLMLSQIQPHFIYNALNSIHIMIRKDADVACQMITNFSAYLRANMDAMGEQKLVTFEKELAHIRAYAEIEQIRFPRIKVLYEIDKKDFWLPVLTVEPLVENAIKHGVAKKRGEGVVIIKAYLSGDFIYVEVSDNGVGFNTKILEEDEQRIGIRNVKYRLERLMGGTLTIESREGQGTTAAIRLPLASARGTISDENDLG